jgi:transcriptional regulator with XRE-family HTH domain
MPIVRNFVNHASAEKIGSGKSYIWEIENKGVKRPSAEKLAAIAKALDVTTDYLIDDTQTEVSAL